MNQMWFDDADKDGYVKEMFIPKRRFNIFNGFQSDSMKRIYNGKKNIYTSVYWYKGNEPKPFNAYIDKIFLDFDPGEDMKFFDNVKTVAKYLHNLNINFEIRFSGRGFHLFVQIDTSKTLKNPKFAIRKWVKELHNKTNTTSDMAVVGDLRRVCRLLGTKNLKTHLYCIALQYHELLSLSYDMICEMAKQPSIDSFPNYDGYGLDLSNYDVDMDEQKDYSINVNVKSATENVITGFPECIQNLLKNPDLGYHERRELIIFLRDMGYDIEEVINILSHSLSNNKFEHCVYEENQVEYLFNREDILFSTCMTQKLNGICCSSTCQGNNLYI